MIPCADAEPNWKLTKASLYNLYTSNVVVLFGPPEVSISIRPKDRNAPINEIVSTKTERARSAEWLL